MMRAIGFLSGIALTVAAFLLVLDHRENRRADPALGPAGDATPQQLSEVFEAIAERVDVAATDHASAAGTAAEPDSAFTAPETRNGFQLPPPGPQQGAATRAVTPDSQPASPGGATANGFRLSSAPAERHLDVQTESAPAIAPGTASATRAGAPQAGLEPFGLPAEQHLDLRAQADSFNTGDSGGAGLHLFWSPFRSEWSAQGFARRLRSATRVPVEVVAAGSGQYRVAFSYQDETERLAHIERIETITGLRLE
jgi:hypothetical protein